MGLLDKIFSGASNNGGISSIINKEVDEIHAKQIESEKELQLRKQAGQEIEDWCILESRSKGLPYDCFSGWEVKNVEEANIAMDDLKGTLRLLTCAQNYLIDDKEINTNEALRAFNVQHSLLWVDRLCERAKKGSVYARSAVTSNYYIITHYEEISKRIDEVIGEEKSSYYQFVMDQVKSDNPSAMVGHAFFHLFGDESKIEERKSIFRKAGEMGSSEAYDQLFYLIDNRWGSEEGFEIALAAAECDDGEISYEYQNRLGDEYWYGGNWIKEQDKNKALYWYRRAANNGYRMAITTLDILKNNGEL